MTNQPNNKILIVEDEISLLDAMKDKFGQEGFVIVTARNGQEGLQKALQELPSLIILDLLMPGMGGMDMLRSLRNEGEYGKNVKVVILTNLDANDKIIKEVVETQPTYYLVKADMTIDGVLNKIKEVFADEPDKAV